MNSLETFTKNPFYTIRVARPRVQKFTFDHIERLKAVSNPNFAAIIASTTVLWQDLFGNIETYDVVLNEQVSFTNQVNKKMHEFVGKAVDLEPFVLIKYKKDNPVYQEFYPHGLTEYHNITQSTALVLMDRLVTKTHTYAADVGPTWEPEFTALRSGFQTLLASQKGKMGEVDDTVSGYEEQVKLLYIQLFKNTGLILAEYPDHPERLLDFFNETLVNFESHIHPLMIPKGEQKASDLTYTIDDTIVITSKFSKPLKYFFAPEADSQLSGTPNILAPNAKIKVKGPVAGAPDNKYVIFINDTDTDANVEVRLE
jgi:hypothetical protein